MACNRVHAAANVLAGVGIGILECEYGPGAGVSLALSRRCVRGDLITYEILYYNKLHLY